MARSLGPGQAALAMGVGPAGSRTPGLPLPPRRMEDPPKIPDPPPPWRLAGPGDAAPLCAGPGPGPGPGGGGGAPGRRRAGGLPAGGGGRRRLLGGTAGLRLAACRGRGCAGLRLTPWSPAPGGGHAPQVRTPYGGGDAPGKELGPEPKSGRQLRAGCASARGRCLRCPGGPLCAPALRSLSAGGRARETARFPGSMGRRGRVLNPPGHPDPEAASHLPASLAAPHVPAPAPPTSGLPGTPSLLGLQGCPRAAASPRPAHPRGGANSSSLHSSSLEQSSNSRASA